VVPDPADGPGPVRAGVAHFSILHFLFDPAEQTSEFIANERWNTIFWRGFDWLLLMTVLFHSFLGMRTIVRDYVRGGGRTALLMGLYALAGILFVLGTIVVMTLPMGGER
jgi:succinate dehydrogenase hydrophobic anchor subunit